MLPLGKLGISGRSAASTRSESTGSGGWFGRAHKFAEEPALGEQFMVQDVGHGGRLGMGTKIQVVWRETAPNRDDLVGLAGIRIQQMLEEWVTGARNILRRNGNEVVVHDGASSPGLNCEIGRASCRER